MVALNNPRDKNHSRSVSLLVGKNDVYLLPEVILPEVSYLLKKAGGVPAVIQFLGRLVITKAQLQSLTLTDVKRAQEIIASYPEVQFDLVDCCLMALSERLNIHQICTFDRRDFSIFRLTHCDYLELLP